MDLQTLIAILGGIAGLGAVAVGIARYLTKNQQQIDLLRDEIKTLQEQATSLRATMQLYPEHTATDVFEELASLSTQAAQALKVGICSLSVPVPSHKPIEHKIIFSTDPDERKIVGSRIPLEKGFVGWVYRTGEAHFVNDAGADPKHYGQVGKAAETDTGEHAILTYPLMASKRCRGIMQFMKPKGERFTEEDLEIVSRWAPRITKLLIELEERPQQDIPSVARGNLKTASIVFTDITAFSKVVARGNLGTAVELLNQYYRRMLPIALSREGRLREYVGDGLFISFLLDTPTASAYAAMESAVEMQKEFERIRHAWQQFGHPVSSANVHSIGIATGQLYFGIVGHPSERREKLVGPAVNSAAHLCTACKRELGGGILVCPRTAEFLGERDQNLEHVTLSVGPCFRVGPYARSGTPVS